MEMMLFSATSPEFSSFSLDNGVPKYRTTINQNSGTFYNMLASKKNLIYTPLHVIVNSLLENKINFDTAKKTENLETISIQEKIETVLFFYSLSKSHLCRIVAISRPALYAWIENKSQPDYENFKKIEVLYKIKQEITTKQDQHIFRGFIEQPVNGYKDSLLNTLIKNDNIDLEQIKKHIQKIFELSVLREKNITERQSGSFAHTNGIAIQELNLEDNL